MKQVKKKGVSMKRGIKRIAVVILILFLLTAGSITVFAEDTGFSTSPLSEEKVADIVENVSMTMFTEEPPKRNIHCFDVAEDGTVAIGYSNLTSKTICVYSSDGEFKYGYSFRNAGNFGIDIIGELLYVCSVRGGVAIAINFDGEIVGGVEIHETRENSRYWQNHIFEDKRTVGENEYILKRNNEVIYFESVGYSQLVKITPDGEEIVIHNAKTHQLISTIFIIVGVVVFIGTGITIGLLKINKIKKKT